MKTWILIDTHLIYTHLYTLERMDRCASMNKWLDLSYVYCLYIYIVMRTFVLVDKTTKTMDDMGKIGRRTWTHA